VGHVRTLPARRASTPGVPGSGNQPGSSCLKRPAPWPRLSKQPQGEELREARRQTAQRLLDLARDCEKAPPATGRRQGAPSRRSTSSGTPAASEADGERSAQQWIVREKPTLRFDSVAGLDDVKEDIRLKMIYPFEHAEGWPRSSGSAPAAAS